MAMIMHLFSLLLLGVIVYAQRPLPCQAPPAWYGYRVRLDRVEKREIREKYYYDKTNLRKRHAEEIISGEDRDFLDVYSFYASSQKKRYNFNPVTKECNMTQLTEPFRVYEISPGDRFVAEATVGNTVVPGEGLTVQVWAGNMSKTDVGDRYLATWTMKDCFLVSYAVFNNVTGMVETANFYDINMGLENNAFLLPYECSKLG